MSERPPLTPGVRRCLDLAGRLAARRGKRQLDSESLVCALATDETLAAEILNTIGFDPTAFCGDFELDEPMSADGFAPKLPLDETVTRVLDDARNAAARAGTGVDAGTEHLLWTFARSDDAVAARLAAQGVTAESIEPLMHHPPQRPGEPLAVDVDLRPDGRDEVTTTRVLRILDAAANRATEGLRVVEDYARFVLDDEHLTRQLKQSRHAVVAALHDIDPAGRLASRDTRSDVGTDISTSTEQSRSSTDDVVTANCKRIQEALRTLEEYGKTISPSAAGALQRLRYEVYTLEKALDCTSRRQRDFSEHRLYVLVTGDSCRLSWESVVRDAVAGGASILQLREKSLSDRELLERGRRFRQITRESGAMFIMNDRPDLAVLLDADGVHVGEDECGVAEARRIVGPNRLVGVSTHSIDQARQAVLDGADYLGVGPVFPSTTKNFDALAGPAFVRDVAKEISLPWFAIGGIDTSTLGDVLDAGATRVAVSGAVCGADEPRQVCGSLSDVLAQR